MNPAHDPSSAGRPGAQQIARSLRALTDPTRVQILQLIAASPEGRRPVTAMADLLGLTQPTVSHHLRVLAAEHIVQGVKEGRLVWYSIAPDRQSEVDTAIRDHGDVQPVPLTSEMLERIAGDLAERFRGTFSRETVAEYVAETFEILAKQARVTRFLPSLTARFAADRLRALAATAGQSAPSVPKVLFVCVQNAGRSQLAAALLRSLAGERVQVSTAGSAPASEISPSIVSALDEIGVSVEGEYPKPLTDEVVRAADYVITMGCGDACPVYPGRRYLDWDLNDPIGLPMQGIREVRDDIESRVRDLIAEIDSMNSR